MWLYQILFCAVIGVGIGECRWETVASFATEANCHAAEFATTRTAYGYRCVVVK